MVHNLEIIGLAITVILATLKISNNIDTSVANIHKQISTLEIHLAVLENKLTNIENNQGRDHGPTNNSRR